MGRARSPNREKAFNLFRENEGAITSKKIAETLNEKICNINSWRITDKWKERLKSKVGAPYCNKNAIGNKGGTPLQNQK